MWKLQVTLMIVYIFRHRLLKGFAFCFIFNFGTQKTEIFSSSTQLKNHETASKKVIPNKRYFL